MESALQTASNAIIASVAGTVVITRYLVPEDKVYCIVQVHLLDKQ